MMSTVFGALKWAMRVLAKAMMSSASGWRPDDRDLGDVRMTVDRALHLGRIDGLRV